MTTPWRRGPRNSLTDIAGIRVGHAQDDELKSGSTAVLFDRPCAAAVEILGGAPGTRETELLAPDKLVTGIDALVLSGGSAFGLDAASGVQAYLRSIGRGFEVAGHRVPLVPAAILFDLANGGNKDWGLHSPYRDIGFRAAESAGPDFALGSVGAGTGATTATVKGGLGTASVVLRSGATVAALVAVNASVRRSSATVATSTPRLRDGGRVRRPRPPGSAPRDVRASALQARASAGSGHHHRDRRDGRGARQGRRPASRRRGP